MIRVWVDRWQMQCCGAPFAIGDTVTWTLAERSDSEWLSAVAGVELSESVVYHEEHHGGLPDGAPTTSGTVTAIRAVSCRFAARADLDDLTNYPVPGTTEVTEIRRADGWESDRGWDFPKPMFQGYVVDLADSEGAELSAS